ncbi:MULTISPECIES: hypothetical protein [Tenacibaculum]|uniref:Uncharacterized protein n=1 Tax=Tenacibaculum geojense TaxID=915352 RepID=A0ABW3JNM5_9FLAO
MTKNLPYWLCNKGTTCDSDDFEDGESFEFIKEVSLIKLKDERYQVSEIGAFRNILDGYGYALIDNKIADILKKYVSDQIDLKQTIIFRRATNEEWTNYSELIMKNKIEFNEYYQTESVGLNIYGILNGLIYVSADLKDLIEKELTDLTDIEFKRGLPLMAG